MDMQNTTMIVSCQHPWLFGRPNSEAYRPAVEKMREKSVDPMASEDAAYNRRFKEAFDLGKSRNRFRTQDQFGRMIGCSQQNVQKLLTAKPRSADGSAHTVRAAYLCGVSPLWLETGEGNRDIDRESMSDEAALLGIAWSFLSVSLRTRIAMEVLENALKGIDPDSPFRSGLQRWLDQIEADIKRQEDLHPTKPSYRPRLNKPVPQSRKTGAA